MCVCHHDRIDEMKRQETDTNSGEFRGRRGGALLCEIWPLPVIVLKRAAVYTLHCRAFAAGISTTPFGGETSRNLPCTDIVFDLTNAPSENNLQMILTDEHTNGSTR